MLCWTIGRSQRGVGSYEREYTYDKVGNRTRMRLFAENGSTIEDVTWTMEYNGLNQLTKRYSGASWSGVSGDIRFEYTYDANGNLTGVKNETKSGSTWSQAERWAYTWTPRDQMRYATKYNAADAFSGRVEYKYCLSCDGALSERIEYNPSWTVVSHRRYEYDGLNLVRLDERYDADTPPDGIDAGDPWRTLEATTHKPGALASLLHKRVYTHANNDATPEAAADFTYAYDAVGNVYCVWDGDGNEVFYFAQDAFGNELPVDLLGQDSWSTARAAGMTLNPDTRCTR
ncbi:MAG: hypothetical protein GHCLOJNM_02292 [bacterium]|nr:hypothetical protein [bacterium]